MSATAAYSAPVIDACVFHEWRSSLTLVPYMSSGWRDFITRRGDLTGPLNVKSGWAFESPGGRKAAGAHPEKGPPGSDYDLMLSQVLSGGVRERVVLGYDDGLLATAYPIPHMARQIIRAANDWTLDQWLGRDDRLYGMVLIVSAMPDEAAAEIRRVGSHERMVAVAMGTNGLARPFGHPAYQPIYQAAAELGLPLVIQVGVDSASDLSVEPLAGGQPVTYAEYDTFGAHQLQSHATSLIMGGVLDLFPNLRVLLVGGGAAWVPGFLWRIDYHYKMSRNEAPWLRGLPGEYFERHFRVATHSLESPPDPARLAQVLRAIPGVESVLTYASCYPNFDSEEPASIAARLPEPWHQRVFHDNAMGFFRWPGGARSAAREPAISPEQIAERLPAGAAPGDHAERVGEG